MAVMHAVTETQSDVVYSIYIYPYRAAISMLVTGDSPCEKGIEAMVVGVCSTTTSIT